MSKFVLVACLQMVGVHMVGLVDCIGFYHIFICRVSARRCTSFCHSLVRHARHVYVLGRLNAF